MTPETVKQHLYKHRLISIIRGKFGLEGILKLAEALLSGGVKVVEVTLNSTDALTAISQLNEHFAGDMLVGAGTVRTASDVKDAINAGASFLIAPCLDLPSVEAAKAHNTLLLPGIFTASEAQTAYVEGCQTVKLFPADALGPSYLKALRAPLDHIDFVPTGGVNHETIGAFHQAGAVAFGVGSALVKNVEVTADELTALTERARVLVNALAEARASS
ncbi:MAG: bifunctional 4-hydroxy-2-oxoglutarate aldolase/2-dehydro-3-deoxy-phosphogluconate aldolase [Deinococcota bacterium]